MSSVLNMVGGAGGKLKSADAILAVTVKTGSTVTAAKSGITLTPITWVTSASSSLDYALFSIPASTFDSTAWTVTATLNGDTASDTIVIDTNDYYTLRIKFRFWVMKAGVYTDASVSKYQGNCSATTGSGYVIYKMTDNNWATWYTNSQVDVTDYSKMIVILTGGKTRYWDRFGLRSSKTALGTQNQNIFSVASVSTGASGSDTTISGTLTLSTDISSVTGSYWFGFTLEGTSGFNDGTYGRGGFKVTDMYFEE